MKKRKLLASFLIVSVSLLMSFFQKVKANNADYYMKIGNEKMSKNENFYGAKKALLDFDKAIEIDHLHEGSYVSRCYAKYLLNEYYSAISDCNMALKISTNIDNKIGAYINRGISKEKLGDITGACSDWRQASYLGDYEAKNWVRQDC